MCEVAVVECEPQQLRVAGGGGGRGRGRGVSGAGQQEVAVSGGGVEVPRPLSFYLQAGRRRGGLGALEQFQLERSTGFAKFHNSQFMAPWAIWRTSTRQLCRQVS